MDQPVEGNISFMALLNGVGTSTRQNEGGRQSYSATDDAGPGLSLGNNCTRARKKSLQRLNKRQTEILEGFFSVCGHPDNSQKKQLSRTTGLAMDQVKFWFQNKRTHVKNLCEKEENYRLKVENEILRDENRRLKLGQNTRICTKCSDSGEQDQLAVEMERLKGRSEWLQQQISRLHETTLGTNLTSQLDPSAENVLARQHDTQMVAELAKNAMNTLIISAETHVSLWFPVPGGSFEILNKLCYEQAFGGENGTDAMGFKIEATRADGIVMLDHTSILDYLMDSVHYRTLFPGVLSGAVTNKIYMWPTTGGYNGVIQLMTVEMPSPSPLVPSRKCTFLRYCNMLQEGAVVVVDVSLDDVNGFSKCLKMPSGMLIQSLRQNTCKISAIEHVRVDDTGAHELYQPCLSGLLFGARRWVASMARQSARMRDVYNTKPTLRVSSKGRKTLMKLADDLLSSYAGGIAASRSGSWVVISGTGTEDDIKIAYRRTSGNGRNDVIIISASASLRLPLSMRKTFLLLREPTLRSKWDVIMNGGVVREEVPIARGVGDDDAVTVLHIKRTGEGRERAMILQNRSYDASGSFMVYSMIESELMNTILSPTELPDATKLSLCPTGFFLVPDGEAAQDVSGADFGEAGGTLMTIGFQIPLKLADVDGMCARSVPSAINLMTDTIATIKRTLVNDQVQAAINGLHIG